VMARNERGPSISRNKLEKRTALARLERSARFEIQANRRVTKNQRRSPIAAELMPVTSDLQK